MQYLKRRSTILAVALALLTAPSATASMKKVYFRHKTDKTLKLDCQEFKRRDDAFPTYRCNEDNGGAQIIKPGPVWELVEKENVCFLHTGLDTIKPCLKITGRDKAESEFACFEQVEKKREMFWFQPGAKWLEIDGKDPRCVAHIPSIVDPPQNVEFSEPSTER